MGLKRANSDNTIEEKRVREANNADSNKLESGEVGYGSPRMEEKISKGKDPDSYT